MLEMPEVCAAMLEMQESGHELHEFSRSAWGYAGKFSQGDFIGCTNLWVLRWNCRKSVGAMLKITKSGHELHEFSRSAWGLRLKIQPGLISSAARMCGCYTGNAESRKMIQECEAELSIAPPDSNRERPGVPF
jgi:hypothetical protein